MKKGIHPEYHRIMVKCTSCGAEFETGSTANYVLILAQTVIHSSLVVRDLLLPRDVSRSLTRNTDLNKNTHKKEGNLFFSFIGKPSLS